METSVGRCLLVHLSGYSNIKGFAIQGGDPSGTGKGGESIYGGFFEDEFVSTLKVSGCGRTTDEAECVGVLLWLRNLALAATATKISRLRSPGSPHGHFCFCVLS